MSTATLDTKTSELPADAPVLLAVSYLRVSTREQAERGGTEEGFSIPAQREANQRKADELGARIVHEFVDAGESARSADRDGLKEMLADAAAQSGRSAREQADEFVKTSRPSSIIQRAADVEEVANLAVYLASPLSSATTGAALRVDGGVVDTLTM